LNNRLRDIGEARGAINNAGKKPAAAMAGVSAPRHRLLPWITAVSPVNMRLTGKHFIES
jgi:hypothetical protein